MIGKSQCQIRADERLTFTWHGTGCNDDFRILTLIVQFQRGVNRAESFSHMAINIRCDSLRLGSRVQLLDTWNHSEHRQANRSFNIECALHTVI